MSASQPLRVSARTLAEFTYFQSDITPSSLAALQAGTKGHLNRQSQAEGRAEVPIFWQGEAEGLPFLVSGRIDLLQDAGSPPVVEEIKLCQGDAPLAPHPAHLAQALCYAFMLAEKEKLAAVALTVRYVLPEGDTVCHFSQTLSHDALREGFFALLMPYARHMARVQALRKQRDESLSALPFPYPDYRKGQRDMAAQAYIAIARRKKLFAVMPTGTGKSAAVLYPALKALGKGLTRQVFFLTARTTGREAALKEVQRMREQGAQVRGVVLSAKEKSCPQETMRCHPDACPRAKGHYEREREAISQALDEGLWDEGYLQALSQRHQLCPFELSLSLSLYADVVVCDYNYALDPIVYLQRVFDQNRQVTLLIDEAHNLPGRVGDMLSTSLSGQKVILWRREAGKLHGRSSPVYKALTGLLHALRQLDETLDAPPDSLQIALEEVSPVSHLLPLSAGRDLYCFVYLYRRALGCPRDYAAFIETEGKEKRLTLQCLHFTEYLKERTRKKRGCVFFSATLSPLHAMRDLLGGDEEDACFALPSPFPEDNLLVMNLPVDTRYQAREQTAPQVAAAIEGMYGAHPGKYLVFFPSYAYLRRVAELLDGETLPLHVQTQSMLDSQRADFLRRFTGDGGPVLGLCVLGGVFAEGIDLPGLSLIGVCVVGVGLPMVNPRQEKLRGLYDDLFDNGFNLAYRYPGMHKVLQAAGRVIRSGEDRGVVLLLDERYRQGAYQQLLPPHYRVQYLGDAAQIAPMMQEFYHQGGIQP